jgi:ABC-type ATPase with predicted acetyltransferase domain
MQMTLAHSVPSAVEPTPNVLEVATMFGLGIDHDRPIQLIPKTDIKLNPGQLVFVTGASGSGKSTILRLLRKQIEHEVDAHALNFDCLPKLQDRPLVDIFPNRTLSQTLKLLSLAGLNDAFVMLRKPSQLSDGQRYRLRLAQVMAMVEAAVVPGKLTIILADEFCSTLDRVTAKVLARNVRKWVTRCGVCFVAATTHDDLLAPLAPDTLIEKHLGETLDLVERPTQ